MIKREKAQREGRVLQELYFFTLNSNWKAIFSYGRFPHVPRKIRQLVTDLEQAGFILVPGGKGSHRKFRHSKVPGSVILSGKDGDDAKHYQEKQIRNAVREANK